jgi:DNA-binding LacI/PurR family transcriptional regulator
MPEAKRLTLGVLLDHIASDYQIEMLAGVLRAARQSRARVRVIAGGWIGDFSDATSARNFVYELVPSAGLDGLVVLGGSLSNYCGVTAFADWMQRFGRLPVVTIGVELPDVACLKVDNDHGIYGVVSHLIERHSRLRIAFIRGPENSLEAETRRRAYMRALTDHGITIEERLMVSGGLGRREGILAIAELLDDRHVLPSTVNAVIAVNDDVALGAIEELTRRGISVPEQIAVAGFDDAPNARSANPPLTTVNQCVMQQGFAATRSLIEALERGTRPVGADLRPEVVLRASCGCLEPFANDTRPLRPPRDAATHTFRSLVADRRGRILAALARAGSGRIAGVTGWESKLLDAVISDVTGASDRSIVREFERIVRRNVALGRDTLACHDVLTALRLEILECAGVEPALRLRFEDLFQEARLMLARVATDLERERIQASSLHLWVLTRACLGLLGNVNTDAIAERLAEHLPLLGIESYAISRFEHGFGFDRELAVVAARASGVTQRSAPWVLASDLGVDDSLAEHDLLVIEPIEFGGVPLGLAVFDWGAHSPRVYEHLRDLLGAALHGLSKPH